MLYREPHLISRFVESSPLGSDLIENALEYTIGLFLCALRVIAYHNDIEMSPITALGEDFSLLDMKARYQGDMHVAFSKWYGSVLNSGFGAVVCYRHQADPKFRRHFEEMVEEYLTDHFGRAVQVFESCLEVVGSPILNRKRSPFGTYPVLLPNNVHRDQITAAKRFSDAFGRIKSSEGNFSLFVEFEGNPKGKKTDHSNYKQERFFHLGINYRENIPPGFFIKNFDQILKRFHVSFGPSNVIRDFHSCVGVLQKYLVQPSYSKWWLKDKNLSQEQQQCLSLIDVECSKPLTKLIRSYCDHETVLNFKLRPTSKIIISDDKSLAGRRPISRRRLSEGRQRALNKRSEIVPSQVELF